MLQTTGRLNNPINNFDYTYDYTTCVRTELKERGVLAVDNVRKGWFHTLSITQMTSLRQNASHRDI